MFSHPTHTHTHTHIHTHTHTGRDDFDVITDGGKFLGPTGEFNKLQFRKMMKGELERFSRSCAPPHTHIHTQTYAYTYGELERFSRFYAERT